MEQLKKTAHDSKALKSKLMKAAFSAAILLKDEDLNPSIHTIFSQPQIDLREELKHFKRRLNPIFLLFFHHNNPFGFLKEYPSYTKYLLQESSTHPGLSCFHLLALRRDFSSQIPHLLSFISEIQQMNPLVLTGELRDLFSHLADYLSYKNIEEEKLNFWFFLQFIQKDHLFHPLNGFLLLDLPSCAKMESSEEALFRHLLFPKKEERQMCSVCFEEEDRVLFINPCGSHNTTGDADLKLCPDCHLEYITSVENKTKGLDPALCPSKNCSHFILASFLLARNVPQVSKVKHQQLCQISKNCARKNADFHPCPNPKCDALFYVNPEEGIWSSCSQCKKKDFFLPGSKMIKADNSFQKFLEKNKEIKKCPKCSAPTERNKGCAHMTCQKCQHQYHWHTLKPYKVHCPGCKKEHFYQNHVENDENGEEGFFSSQDVKRFYCTTCKKSYEWK